MWTVLIIISTYLFALQQIYHLKEKGEITEEEWMQGLIKDQFINDTENDTEDDSISEQFDLLLREKIGLEELLEKIRNERHELHTKHQKKVEL